MFGLVFYRNESIKVMRITVPFVLQASFFCIIFAVSNTFASNDGPRIGTISIEGNRFIATQAIANTIPYHEGDTFDPLKTRELIRRIYFGLNRIHNVIVKAKQVSPELVDILVLVQEKFPLKDVEFEGNAHLPRKDIEKKIDFVSQYAAIDPEELPSIGVQIKKLYVERGYNHVEIDTKIVIDEDNRASVTFIIDEGKKSTVKQVKFIGNEKVSDKELRKILLTKEDWLLGFMDRSGTYHPEMVEYGDRQAIEHLYQDRGFLHARVVNIITDIDPKTKNITLTYEIEEGCEYIISEVHALGNDIFPEDFLLSCIPIKPGMPYSRELISYCIKRLERLWGNGGYIFAHVDPSIIPDDEKKEVKITFMSDVGKQVILNRLTIRGNKKTRDKIIRRRIMLQEGGLVTNDALEGSKSSVESLGYFDPKDGVLYKIKRRDDQKADVDFIVKEAKTGHAGLRIGYGGSGMDVQSPSSDFSVSLDFSDTNLLGKGINLTTSATWSKSEQTFLFHVAQPWLFDKPFLGAFDIYHRRPVYDELRNVQAGRSHSIHEKLWGGSFSGGVILRSPLIFCGDVNAMGSFGIDNINYAARPLAAISRATPLAQVQYQEILDKSFRPGTFVWATALFEQDTRNNPMHTSRGYRWRFSTRLAAPSFGNKIGFAKIFLDASWYTPLINEYDLVFKLHGYFGYVTPFKNNSAPFEELFNIGGPSSVRGYLFGQIGPKFAGDPIGAKKAFFVNAELIFPIASDMTIKGVCFYDGGAGWDNPYVEESFCPYLVDNNFSYRHSIGVGVRLLKPMPMKIDWGFKIDPRKDRDNPRRNESTHEVHFGMSYDW